MHTFGGFLSQKTWTTETTNTRSHAEEALLEVLLHQAIKSLLYPLWHPICQGLHFINRDLRASGTWAAEIIQTMGRTGEKSWPWTRAPPPITTIQLLLPRAREVLDKYFYNDPLSFRSLDRPLAPQTRPDHMAAYQDNCKRHLSDGPRLSQHVSGVHKMLMLKDLEVKCSSCSQMPKP